MLIEWCWDSPVGIVAEKWLSYALSILADLSVTLQLAPLSPFYKSLHIIGRATWLLKMYCTAEALPGFQGFLRSYIIYIIT